MGQVPDNNSIHGLNPPSVPVNLKMCFWFVALKLYQTSSFACDAVPQEAPIGGVDNEAPETTP